MKTADKIVKAICVLNDIDREGFERQLKFSKSSINTPSRHTRHATSNYMHYQLTCIEVFESCNLSRRCSLASFQQHLCSFTFDADNANVGINRNICLSVVNATDGFTILAFKI